MSPGAQAGERWATNRGVGTRGIGGRLMGCAVDLQERRR